MLTTKAVGRFSLVLLIASSFGAIAVSAQQKCSNADFRGRYAFRGEVEDLRSGADKKYPVRFAGTVYSDGNGALTEWMDTAVAGPPDLGTNVVNERNLVAAAAAAGGKLAYEVTPDCRITIRGTLAIPVGTVDVVVRGALAHGGREAMFVQTSPDFVVGNSVFKSIDPPAQPELAAIKDLLDRVARRNGLLP